jgi:APA family basic amino acid/polyamine antiporter
MPDALRRLHPRFRTPWIGILVFGAAAIVTLLPGQADFLGYMYAFGAMLSFTIAHLAVMRLRRTAPDAYRPYRGPGNLRGIPLFAVFGGLGTTIAFVVTAVLHPEVAAAGFGWLALGILVYVAYRRRIGLDLVSTVKVAIPQPVVDHEAEYDSVLVPVIDGRYDEHVMATATKLAARRRRGIHVLAMVTVPLALPIDAQVADAEREADSIIEQAKIHAGRRVSGHMEKIRAGQAGRRIIEEAIDMRATAIVMPLPRRIAGASLFGKTIETVLTERPCRVVIESAPDGAVTRRGVMLR